MGRTIFVQSLCDNIIRRYVLKEEMGSILYHCHDRELRGHFGATRTVAKVLQSSFYWPSLFLPTSMFHSVTNVKEHVIFLGSMKCLLIMYLFVTYLMCGALTSYDIFLSPTVMSTYLLLSIMCQNG